MRRRYDNSIQSNNTPTPRNTGRDLDYRVYRCMVRKVLFTDNVDNYTIGSQSPKVLYNVVTLGGFREGQIIYNCIMINPFGGNSSYSERILKAATNNLNKVSLQEQDGDIVFVQFVQGDQRYPIIIGVDAGISPIVAGATSEQGSISRSEFNGITETIDNEGQYSMTRRGGVYDPVNQVFTPTPETDDPNFTAKFELLDGSIAISDDLNKIQLIRETCLLSFSLGEDKIVKEFDGKNQKTTTTYEAGLTITEDATSDEVQIVTAGGMTLVINGSSKKFTVIDGDTQLVIDASAAQIEVKADLVRLGSAVTDLATKFTAMASAFNSHSHITTVAGGSSSGAHPTTVPTSPLTQSVGSKGVKVSD